MAPIIIHGLGLFLFILQEVHCLQNNLFAAHGYVKSHVHDKEGNGIQVHRSTSIL